MPQATCAPVKLDSISDLVESGHHQQAKREMRTFWATADQRAKWVIEECARILRNYSHEIARAKLANFRDHAPSDYDARLIDACIPILPSGQHQPEPAAPTRWTPNNRYRAPRDSRRRVDPTARRRPLRNAAQTRAAKTVAAYHDDRPEFARAGVPEGHQLTDRDERGRNDEPYASGFDYTERAERAARDGLRTLPCVHCRLERANADQRPLGADDGLCGDCRELRRPGLTLFPRSADHSSDRATARVIRSAYITEHYPATAARMILREEYRASNLADRATIAQWVKAHPERFREPASPEGCQQCTSLRQLRDGHCCDCRALNDDTSPATPARKEHAAA